MRNFFEMFLAIMRMVNISQTRHGLSIATGSNLRSHRHNYKNKHEAYLYQL
jgi:hypothetical protein